MQQFDSLVRIEKKLMRRGLYTWMVGVALVGVCSAGLAQTDSVAVDLAVGEMTAPAGSAIVREGRLLVAARFAVSDLGYAREDGYKAVTLKVFGHLRADPHGSDQGGLDSRRLQRYGG